MGSLEKGRSPRTLSNDLLALCGFLEIVEAGLDQATARFASHVASPALARRFVTQALERWGSKPEFDVVQLLVSEMVTNAVLHARSEVHVRVAITGEVVRVGLFDQSTDPVVRAATSSDVPSGRGTLLLDRLASAWGVEPSPDGKEVWFELRTASS
jgi:anti-sigma regulatory factor (Ser/Thr protein kinase)